MAAPDRPGHVPLTGGGNWIRSAGVAINWLLSRSAGYALATGLTALETLVGQKTGWGAYIHTGATQSLVATTKVTLTNNAGSVIETQKPSDIATFYSGTIKGREGDGIGIGVELTFTPTSALATWLWLAIDIGGGIGEIYPRRFEVTGGSGVPQQIVYHVLGYTLDTWEANGGTVKIEANGPGDVTGVRYVIHRLHKAF